MSAAQEASAYFNSLPIEQREKLVPLLEDYRRLGMEEAARTFVPVQDALRAARGNVKERVRSIKERPAGETP